MSIEDGRYESELIKACIELDELVLYTRYSNEYYFYLDIPGLEHPAVGSIMGSGGDEFGLILFCGKDALKSFMALCGGVHPSILTRKAHMIAYMLKNSRDLSDAGQKWIKSTKYKYSVGEELPELIVTEPEKTARCPDDKETRILLYAVRAIIKSWMDKTFAPRRAVPETSVFTLVISGEPDDPEVSAEFRYPDGKTQEISTLITEPANMFEFSGLPQKNENWIASKINIPISFPNEERMMPALLIADDKERLLAANMVLGPDAPNVWLSLYEIITGNVNKDFLPIETISPGLPESICFNDKDFFDISKANLEPLGVKCEYSPNDQRIADIFNSVQRVMEKIKAGDIPEELREEFGDLLEDIWDDEDDLGELFDFDDDEEDYEDRSLEDFIGDEIPDNDNLLAWRDVESFLRESLYDIIGEDRYDSSRALKKFFDDDSQDLLDLYEHFNIDESYLAWLAFSYRPTKKSSPLAEKLLSDEMLHPAIVELIRENLKAHPSLYKITKITKDKGQLKLEDVLLGGKVTVIDLEAARTLDPKSILTARIYAAGDFNFMLPAGPPILQEDIPLVTEYLKKHKLEFSREAFRNNAHLFGHLWNVLHEQQKLCPF